MGTAPSVLVSDAYNNVVSGVTVTFTVTAGSGKINNGGGLVTTPLTVNTTGSGIAALTAWQLGSTTTGTNTLTAAVTGLSGSPVTFTATGTAAAASTIAVSAGNSQTAAVGTASGHRAVGDREGREQQSGVRRDRDVHADRGVGAAARSVRRAVPR